MQAYDPLIWLLQTFGLFIAFTVQGAMWKGAQDHGGRGWAVALTWAVAIHRDTQRDPPAA